MKQVQSEQALSQVMLQTELYTGQALTQELPQFKAAT